jgi:SAF domain
VTTRADGKTAPTDYPAPAVPAAPPGPAPAVRTAAASRRVNRRLLALSALVVLLGGLVAFIAGQMLTRHTEVLVVARTVQVGTKISADDLVTANVTADPHLSPIPASQRGQIVGMVAQVTLSPGELLTRSQVGAGSGFTRGQMLVALPLKPGQFPQRGLAPGQQVLVVSTPGSSGTAATSGAPPADNGTATGSDRAVTATVADVGSKDAATGLTVVDVRVSSEDGVAVAQLGSTGNLALILLPAGR